MTKKVELKAKSYSYLIDDGSEDKVAKVRKKRVTKTILKFENYKSILEATQLDSKISFLKKQNYYDSLKKPRRIHQKQ